MSISVNISSFILLMHHWTYKPFDHKKNLVSLLGVERQFYRFPAFVCTELDSDTLFSSPKSWSTSLLMIIGLLGLYCLSMAKTSICWVPWTFTLLLVSLDTCHPFAYFLATLRGLNYVVIDILFSLPSLLFSLPPVLASSLSPFLPSFFPPFLFTISYCFCLSTEQVYKYTQSFQRRKCRLHFQWVQTRVRIKTEAQKYQNIQFSKNIQG